MSKPLFTPRSTTMQRVDYFEMEKEIEIQFCSGNVYRYHEVPARLWKVFQLYVESGGSPGSFFNEHIKKKFTCEKIKDVDANRE